MFQCSNLSIINRRFRCSMQMLHVDSSDNAFIYDIYSNALYEPVTYYQGCRFLVMTSRNSLYYLFLMHANTVEPRLTSHGHLTSKVTSPLRSPLLCPKLHSTVQRLGR